MPQIKRETNDAHFLTSANLKKKAAHNLLYCRQGVIDDSDNSGGLLYQVLFRLIQERYIRWYINKIWIFHGNTDQEERTPAFGVVLGGFLRYIGAVYQVAFILLEVAP